MTPPPADLLATYLRLREHQRALNRELTKTLSRKAIEESARRLGFFKGGRLCAPNESDLDLVMDTALYDYFPCNGKNAVERFAPRDLPEEARSVLAAMRSARFTLVQIGASVEGLGVQAEDLLVGVSFLLANVALSGTATPGMVLATRLLVFESLAMTSGVFVVVDEELASVIAKPLAERGATLTPRGSSHLAHFFLQAGMLDPEAARATLAKKHAAQLSPHDPRRGAYERSRAGRAPRTVR